MTTINTYLNFNGNCEKAFNFYKSVFGGEYQFLERFKDMPMQSNFRGDYFGTFTDKFGINWMVSFAENTQEK